MKKNLVLIPGVLCDERVWQRQISYLSPHFSISCLSVSHFKDVEAFLSYALDNVPSRFYLAGHSMGGWLALELLSRIPERIEKLCLLATSADCDNEARSKARMQVLEHFRNEGFEATLPMLMKTYAAKEDNQTELSEMFSAHMSSFVDQQRMLVHRHSCLDLLAKITQETLLLVGDKDPISFDSMQAIATMLPNSRLEILKETGHMLMQEQPDAVNRLLLTFLESGTIANK